MNREEFNSQFSRENLTRAIFLFCGKNFDRKDYKVKNKLLEINKVITNLKMKTMYLYQYYDLRY